MDGEDHKSIYTKGSLEPSVPDTMLTLDSVFVVDTFPQSRLSKGLAVFGCVVRCPRDAKDLEKEE